MSFHPEVGQKLSLYGLEAVITEHPAAKGIPYGQAGRRATVYQLRIPDTSFIALKVFNQAYRERRIELVAGQTRQFAGLPGLKSGRQIALTPEKGLKLLEMYPDLTYAVLMPWIPGNSWQEIIINGQVIEPEAALANARSLSYALAKMEEKGIAHCDISGPNVMLPGMESKQLLLPHSIVELVDLDDIYVPGMVRSKVQVNGSDGYRHRSPGAYAWSQYADRFAAAILLSEMLGWSDARVRVLSFGEHYFDQDDLQTDCQRYEVLRDVLIEHYGRPVASLLASAWQSRSLDECPALTRWYEVLGQPGLQMDQTGQSVADMFNRAQVLLDIGQTDQAIVFLEKAYKIAPDLIADRYALAMYNLGGEREKSGQLFEALNAYQMALRISPPGSLKNELPFIIRDLQKHNPKLLQTPPDRLVEPLPHTSAQTNSPGDLSQLSPSQPSTGSASSQDIFEYLLAAGTEGSAQLDPPQQVWRYPLGLIRAFGCSNQVLKVLDRAIVLTTNSTAKTPVDSSILLFALMDIAQEDTTNPALEFFAGCLKREAVRPEQVRKRYINNRLGEVVTGGLPIVPEDITENAAQLFNSARSISARLEGKEILPIHLIAAFLQSRQEGSPLSAHERLAEMQVNLESTRDQFLQWLKACLVDDYPVWLEMVLGTDNAVPLPTEYAPDAVSGQDLIGIGQEVGAMAALIASRSMAPPLSIGLFGEWGSGKTFFMKQLEQTVDALSRQMRESGKMQRDLPYYKRIVQIKFNAWHYINENIWASLTNHILEKLEVPDDAHASLVLKNKLFDELGVKRKLKEEIDRQVIAGQTEVMTLQTNIDRVQDEIDSKEEALEKVLTKEYLFSQVYKNEHLREKVSVLLNEIGLGFVVVNGQGLAEGLKEADETLNSFWAIFRPLLYSPRRARRWAVLISGVLLVVALSWLVGWLAGQFAGKDFTWLARLVSGLITFLAMGVQWFNKQKGWVSRHLGQLASVQYEFDQRIAKETAAQSSHKKVLETELAEAQLRLHNICLKQEDAKKRVEDAQAELENLSASRLLTTFIRDRAESQDYRKYLGLLALVNRDFQIISDLMEEINWRLAPEVPGEEARSKSKKFHTLEEEERDPAYINRIVLYIDDLDRCPPQTVVDVLQAVHLLLAFPLFVVIVGVDSRWITHSLRANYQQVLHHNDGSLLVDEREDTIFGKATPDDYLEKIFQIPYWIRPMTSETSWKMIAGLVGPVVQSAPPAVEAGGPVEANMPRQITELEIQQPSDQPEQTFPLENSRPRLQVQASEAGPAEQSLAVVNSMLLDSGLADSPQLINRVAGETQATGVQSTLPVEDNQLDFSNEILQPLPAPTAAKNLEITADEFEAMHHLSPLIYRSPRTLKRFINIYRLIKAGLTAHQLRVFRLNNAERGMSEYKAVLFLLAVDNGLPDVARVFFEVLMDPEFVRQGAIELPVRHREVAVESSLTRQFSWLINTVEERLKTHGVTIGADGPRASGMPNYNQKTKEQWRELNSWLLVNQPGSPNGYFPAKGDLSPLSEAVKRVARYSFHFYNQARIKGNDAS